MDADELVRAIRAALDETERIANEALSHPTRWHGAHGERAGTDDGVWRAGSGMDDCRVEGIGITIYDEGGHSAEQARHIAHNDPAAVLRRVTALREIVDAYERAHRVPLSQVSAFIRGEDRGYREAYEDVLRALARGLGINPEETP